MRKEKIRKEIDLAITALFHESARLADRVWTIQLAPPPDHEYHTPEDLDAVIDSLGKCNHAMRALLRNLKKEVEA